MSEVKPPPVIAFPLEKLTSILDELSHLENLSRSLLKWYASETELEEWDESALPTLIDISASAAKLTQFIVDKMKNPTPEELLVAAAMGFGKDTLPFMEQEVVMISSALSMIDQHKTMLRMKYNISFEVH